MMLRVIAVGSCAVLGRILYLRVFDNKTPMRIQPKHIGNKIVLNNRYDMNKHPYPDWKKSNPKNKY